MLSSRAVVAITSLPTPDPDRTEKALRGLLQRLLCGPNSFPAVTQLFLGNRIQEARGPARTASSTFLLSCAPIAVSPFAWRRPLTDTVDIHQLP
jgi:hypothetical protein